MAKKLNYNYAFVFYDVNEKRVQKVFKAYRVEDGFKEGDTGRRGFYLYY